MASPIDIATIINSISTCADEAEQAESNKAICKEIADELLVIHKILSNLDHEGKEKVEKHKLDFILKKIHKIVCRSRVLFDKCRSGKILVRIRNFLGAASIKEELEKLKNEALISIAVLCLVLKIKTEVNPGLCMSQ